jgi:hypothetical protein
MFVLFYIVLFVLVILTIIFTLKHYGDSDDMLRMILFGVRNIIIVIFIMLFTDKDKVFTDKDEFFPRQEKYTVSSFSLTDTDFTIGITADGEKYLLYEETTDGKKLHKYDVDKTEIFTVENGKEPYVKIVRSRSFGYIRKIELYVPENMIVGKKN